MQFRPGPAEEEVRLAARRFAREELAPRARQGDEEGRFDAAMVPKLGAAGLLGGPLPEEVGGRGWSAVAWALAMMELGAVDSSWRGFATVQAALCGEILHQNANEAQRPLVGELARGEKIFAFALTEPEAGSDVISMTTRAREDGDHWVIDGRKHWITNGGVADWILLFATVDPERRKDGISCFLVPGDAPGLRRCRVEGEHFGHRSSDHAVLDFEGVRVPKTAVLGAVGEGFALAMGGLGHGRLSVAAGAVGIQDACLELCLERARSRRQFGRRIGDFQLVQGELAEMHVARESTRLLTLQAAALLDAGESNQREVSVAKFAASEAAVRAADRAILLCGASGYSSTCPAGRLYRDAKGLQIYEGTAHIQRVIIARQLLGKDQA